MCQRSLFLIDKETKIIGPKIDDLEEKLAYLRNYVSFGGTDLGKVESKDGKIHLSPLDRHVMSFGDFSIYSKGKDGSDVQLTVKPFFELLSCENYLGLELTLGSTSYVLHQVDKCPLPRDF